MRGWVKKGGRVFFSVRLGRNGEYFYYRADPMLFVGSIQPTHEHVTRVHVTVPDVDVGRHPQRWRSFLV